MDAQARIALDDPDEDLTHWYVPRADGMMKVETTITSDEAYDLLQAVIEVGLREAGIVDVNRCTRRRGDDPGCPVHGRTTHD